MDLERHGDLVVDEIPGLLDALLLAPTRVQARVLLTDTTTLECSDLPP
ncbi:MAG: hypothetical protein ACOH2F_04760 [Cellulomonas sp.]